MYVLGITGGIGTGKSMILDLLAEEYHAAVIRADEVGHDVMEPGQKCYEPVTELLGREVTGPDGRIDRKKAAAILFADPDRLEQMNRIIHPAVHERILQQLEREKAAGRCLMAVESALLLQAGYREFCDEVWTVWCDEQTRIRRLMESRGYTLQKCEDILRAQPSAAWYRERADFVLDNSGTPDRTERQIRGRLAGLLQKV